MGLCAVRLLEIEAGKLGSSPLKEEMAVTPADAGSVGFPFD
jgi:hypothetical protein